MDPSIEQVTAHSGQGEDLAILESVEHHQNCSPQQLAYIKGKIFQHYTEDIEKAITRRHTDETVQGARVKMLTAEEEKKTQFISRLAMALFGGLALIAPMLIMTLHQTRLTTLLTTSLFVVAVAVILGWKMPRTRTSLRRLLPMPLYWWYSLVLERILLAEIVFGRFSYKLYINTGRPGAVRNTSNPPHQQSSLSLFISQYCSQLH